MRYKIPLPLFVLFIGTLLVTAASFTGIGANTASFVLKNNGVATNLTTYGLIVTNGLQSYGVSGNLAVQMGLIAQATGSSAISIGYTSFASGLRSMALGRQANTTNDYSVAIGYLATTTADNQIRLGRAEETVSIPGKLRVTDAANFDNGLIVTNGLQSYGVSGNLAVQMGLIAQATGSSAISIGYTSFASGLRSMALGRQANTTNDYSVAIGYLATTTADNQIRLGRAEETVSIPGALAVNGTITQSRNTLTYTGGTNVLVDCSLGNDFTLTVTAPVYLLFTNVPAVTRSWTANVQFKQNATGGYTTTLAATNCTGTNLTFSVVANAVTLLSVVNSAYTNGQVIGNALISQ